LTIVESPALGKEVRDWSVLLKDALVETCGEDNMEVGIFKYNLSSDQFTGNGYMDKSRELATFYIPSFSKTKTHSSPRNGSHHLKA